MKGSIRVRITKPRQLTYSNTVATTALVLAFAGGGTAAVAAGSIGKNAVKSQHIAAGAVHTSDLARSSVVGAKIDNGSVTSADLGADSVGSEELADKSVGGQHLVDNSITGAAVNESTLGEVPLAAGLRGMMRVSVNAAGEVVSFSAPTKPTVVNASFAPDARVVTFPGVDVASCSLLAGVAQNVKATAVRGVATAWPGNNPDTVTVETNADFDETNDAGTAPLPFTLLVMC